MESPHSNRWSRPRSRSSAAAAREANRTSARLFAQPVAADLVLDLDVDPVVVLVLDLVLDRVLVLDLVEVEVEVEVEVQVQLQVQVEKPGPLGSFGYRPSARSFASCARARTEKPGVCEASSVATVGNGFARARMSSSFSVGIEGEPRRSHGSCW